MSSLRNFIPRRAYRERSQPESRQKFGLLEKHKDYVLRAKNYHQKQQTLQKLKEKAAFRNPDEFSFKMIKTKTVGEFHKPERLANRYSKLTKSQDIVYGKLQAEKRKIEKLKALLHSLGYKSSNRRVNDADNNIAASCKELETRKNEVQKLERLYSDMTMEIELQKNGGKQKILGR